MQFASMTITSSVDFNKFAATIRTKRGERGLRQIAEEIGQVSASTLSRIEQGNVPDLETFMRICQWLCVSADEFRLNATGDQADPEEIIEAHLRADRTLPRVQDKILLSGSERERIVGSDPVIEAVFPERGEMFAAVDTAEGEDFLGSLARPEHPGLFAP
jgi:transcriptional regulator with XRE-family HTH domain